MAMENDVARIRAALNTPGLKYRSFGNQPVRGEPEPPAASAPSPTPDPLIAESDPLPPERAPAMGPFGPLAAGVPPGGTVGPFGVLPPVPREAPPAPAPLDEPEPMAEPALAQPAATPPAPASASPAPAAVPMIDWAAMAAAAAEPEAPTLPMPMPIPAGPATALLDLGQGDPAGAQSPARAAAPPPTSLAAPAPTSPAAPAPTSLPIGHGPAESGFSLLDSIPTTAAGPGNAAAPASGARSTLALLRGAVATEAEAAPAPPPEALPAAAVTIPLADVMRLIADGLAAAQAARASAKPPTAR